ncbi:putative leader peptide [Streptomyces yangpuensis]|nr:putative leader peptide [Streptomyces sp. NRRL S-378]
MRAVASLPLPLLTSRRHIDLLRVCSAADPVHHSPAPVRR